MQPLTWFQFFWVKQKGVLEPRNKFLRCIYDLSSLIIKSAYVRTFLYVVISIGLAACAVVTVVGCNEVHIDEDNVTVLSNCISSWVSFFYPKNLKMLSIYILYFCKYNLLFIFSMSLTVGD